MRGITRKIGLALAAAGALLLTVAHPAAAGRVGASPGHAAAAAYFEFDYPPMPDKFVVEIADPAEVQHARALLDGTATDRPHVMGRIVKRSAPYNPGWSYHLDPASVRFFDVAIEVCDAAPQYVEDHLDEAGGAFLPGGFWCPWGSRLLREVRAS
ncbi:hypothetical protein Sme01_04560 [Sphaerisporangium melleum]|uniref:BP74 N-terminal domain-containing protein n=1 Tax=Sphaerisporangium melleum TaxID=321316 RepID=A0A917QQ11_9ACTN|nr:calmodulin-binding protein [Sphaerisporangium melleum]GGK62582.1 hypothetical protein GCM10007964_02110 [Sphaerisporangium melleum]GII67980.1 hypothetical protein Sme01_04560 [Sphaerisporangium melleum]